MLRSNLIRFINQTNSCYTNPYQLGWTSKTNNAYIFLFTPQNIFFDYLNTFQTFFNKKINTTNKITFSKKYLTTHWTRIAFRGKSYRVRCLKSINKFTFNLGYSHWTKFKANKSWALFRKRRQRYIVFSYNLLNMQFFKRILPTIRNYNPYTMRGLRLRKQPIIRRFGKISQHVSILH